MAGSNIYNAKVALLAAIDALPALDGVTVGWSYSGKAHGSTREYIYLGSASGPVTAGAMAAGGRYLREESPVLQLHVLVEKLGQETTQTAEARAIELGTAVEEYLAANWTLGVAGLLAARVVDEELDSAVDDDGAQAIYTLGIQLTSHVR